MDSAHFALFIILLPLLGATVAGLFGKRLGALPSQLLTIILMGIAFFLSVILVYRYAFLAHPPIDQLLYDWTIGTSLPLSIGLLIDPLSTMMACVVCCISFLVHIYSIGYMAEDTSKQRFFSYISLFTFAMLVLVFSNNFLPLFFGWEGVGLVSYLLIGFYYDKDSANNASLKAFLVNRIADLGFIAGIAGVFAVFHTLDFAQIFAQAPHFSAASITLIPGHPISLITLLCLCIFIGAMGKSAQMPLHVWLPDSMEGPTPISALIHAATMVTAGVYLLARLSPLYELSPTTLSVILIVGASTAFFMGLVGIVQWDIKRVVAYSTLSQLGYMMTAAGASAYSASLFHLFTHAFFKALLFLAAGAVITAVHHDQDMRKMGALAKKIPIIYITFLCGALALVAFPGTSGFYSKDSIIDAVHQTTLFGANYAYYCLLFGVFVTALYTFRCFFLVFHGDAHEEEMLNKVSSTMWVPLVLLAIPSIVLGYYLVQPLLVAMPSLFGNTIFVSPAYNSLADFTQHFQGAFSMAMHAIFTPACWCMIAGIFTAWIGYILLPSTPEKCAKKCKLLYLALVHKLGFDALYNWVFVKGTNALSEFLFTRVDVKLIDNQMVDGSGRIIERLAKLTSKLQSGYLYQYVFVMILGVFALLIWQLK